MNREDILKRPAYWFEHEQNELYRQVTEYMERECINRTELSKRLNVSKGYVSQILNGNFNYTLKKLIELCLAIGIVPGEYRKIEDVIRADIEFAKSKKDKVSERKPEIQFQAIEHYKPIDVSAILNKPNIDSTQIKTNTRITFTIDPLKTEAVYG